MRAATALALCVFFYGSIAVTGAEMSAHSVGVAKVPDDGRSSTAYLGVLVNDAMLDSPASLAAIGARDVSIVLDSATVDRHPDEVASLTASNVDVVNGGCGCHPRLRNRRAHADVSAHQTISAWLGRDVTMFAPARRLDGFDYLYATRAHQRLVRPDRVLDATEPTSALVPGAIYLLDGRGVPPEALTITVDVLIATSARAGIAVAPFGDLR